MSRRRSPCPTCDGTKNAYADKCRSCENDQRAQSPRTKVCQGCGAIFRKTNTMTRWGARRFCSRICQHAFSASPAHFWERVDQSGGPDACWPWLGSATGFGHGHLCWRGQWTNAHRVAWELANGPIPAGQMIRHLVCDNPPCCNPAHLFLGTQADNVADMLAKGRHSHGDDHWQRTARRTPQPLTSEQIAAVRSALDRGLTRAAAARETEICVDVVRRIARGTHWSSPQVAA